MNGGYENEREKGIDRNACSSNDYINDDRLCKAEETKENSDITIAYVTSALTTQIFRDQVTALED